MTDQKRGDVVIAETIAVVEGQESFFYLGASLRSTCSVRAPGTVRDDLRRPALPRRGRLVRRARRTPRRGAARSGRSRRTLVVVTSDHGEALGEHGEDVHGYFVYESTLRVPLVLRGPGVTPGTRFTGVARTVDLFPTIVEIAGLAARPPSSGRSFAPALRGGAVSDEPSFAESLVPLLHYGWSDLRAVRDGRWKYILAPRPELYDLDRDPGELRNLVEGEPDRARAHARGPRGASSSGAESCADGYRRRGSPARAPREAWGARLREPSWFAEDVDAPVPIRRTTCRNTSRSALSCNTGSLPFAPIVRQKRWTTSGI